MSFVELAAARLKEHGHRMTQSRHQILMLFDASEKVLTAEDIQKESSDKKLDSATVYRILQVLEELQIVKKIHIVGGYYKYPLESESTLGWQFCIDQKTHRVVVLPLTGIDSQRQEKLPWFSPHHVSCEILGDFPWSELDRTREEDREQKQIAQKEAKGSIKIKPDDTVQQAGGKNEKKIAEDKIDGESNTLTQAQKTLQKESSDGQKDIREHLPVVQATENETKKTEEKSQQKTLLTKKLQDF